MKNIPTVNIHGKEYVTVATRIQLAHEANAKLSITTEVINQNPIVIKATAITMKGTFTGISSVSSESFKQIEKSNPYEVAETSAIGRALGFAGYGSTESIASADEVQKSIVSHPSPVQQVSTVPITATQKTRVMVLLGEKKKTMDDLANAIKVGFKKTLLKELTSHEADMLIARLESIEEEIDNDEVADAIEREKNEA